MMGSLTRGTVRKVKSDAQAMYPDLAYRLRARGQYPALGLQYAEVTNWQCGNGRSACCSGRHNNASACNHPDSNPKGDPDA